MLPIASGLTVKHCFGEWQYGGDVCTCSTQIVPTPAHCTVTGFAAVDPMIKFGGIVVQSSV
jgi:hypothetical protein